MIAFDTAKYDIASTMLRLLQSQNEEWFSPELVSRHTRMKISTAFLRRVVTICNEDGQDTFETDDDGWITLGRNGFDIAMAPLPSEIEDSGGLAPSADGLVRFDHNSPDFDEIEKQFGDVKEAVRTANDADEAEKSRVIAGLTAAEALWQSLELKLIQLKVGVLMAVEDAAAFLASTSKAVAAALLVDAIKAFVKTQTGIDLERL